MLRRFFHNAALTLKKDKGAHFTYNVGVTLVRVGAALLALSAAIGISVLLEGETDSTYVYFMKMSLIWLPLTGLITLLAGIRQERFAMRYPRTDVDLEEHAIVPAGQGENGGLTKGFDGAYEKYQANRTSGLPTSEPPRTDRAKDTQYRLEKK